MLTTLAAVAAITVSSARAATFTVFNLNDSGPGSLRQAILDANASAGADTITFSVTGTIVLATTLPAVFPDDLTIDGPGAASLTVSGGGSVFILAHGSAANLRLQDLTIADGVSVNGAIINFPGSGSLMIDNSTLSGNSSQPFGFGGAIRNYGTLTISNSTLSGNSASLGGAIFNENVGSLTISGSTLMGNVASGGGAILNGGGTVSVSESTFSGNSQSAVNSSGSLTVDRSTFSGNSSVSGAGAIANLPAGTTIISDSTFVANSGRDGGAVRSHGTLTVTASTFSGNSAWQGGAIANLTPGVLAVESTTFVSNTASASTPFGRGGALFNSGLATVTNSTFSANSASGSIASGGGAVSSTATMTITNASFVGNSASVAGGAMSALAGSFTVRNTIATSSPSGGNCSAAIVDGGGNLSWPDMTCPGINVDPQLGPLRDNGGPTETMALPSGSPAVDAAVAANCPAADQRGVSRPQGAGCDIGAFELDVLQLGIDVMPGSTGNPINLTKSGVVPVAVLATASFDPANVNPATVCFGDAEAPAQRDCTVASGTTLQDVNKDKRKDLVLHFETQQTGIDPGDTQACLAGKLFDLTNVAGCDSITAK